MANHFRDQVFPQDTAAKVALSPFLFPAYACLCVTDVALVNPVRGCQNVPDVVSPIWEWENQNWVVGKALLLPLKFIAIPPAAIGTALISEQFIRQAPSSTPCSQPPRK